uniref:Uncharacterized protein n=1 Tax=Arundo donax TaxID=35708 RepID=A0A0A8ZHF9_ARUDO
MDCDTNINKDAFKFLIFVDQRQCAQRQEN